MMYRRIVRGEKRLMAQRDPLENPEPLIRRVYSYVAYRIGDGADAEDVTSATFERALRYRHSYDEQRGEPAAWLIGIAARCVSELYAQRAPPVAEAVEGVAPGELAAEAPERIDLQRAVATLSDRERELVALRFGADLTARQIAEVLGMKINAVEVALHRLLRTLRETLGQEFPQRRAAQPERPLRAAE
jgi:RNA polymerase sigma factor (sigma-70 family)